MSWLDDLLANVQESLQQAGQKAQSMTDLSGRYMKGQQTPEDTSSLLSSVTSANPITAGIVAPTSNKILQGLWEQAKNVAPKLVGKAEDDPRTLFSYLVSQMPHGQNLGTYQDLPFGPQLQKLMPKGSPTPGSAEIWGGQSKNDILSTLLHEITHFLTGPTLEGKNPEHALETAKQLGVMMPTREAQAVHSYTQAADKLITNWEPANLKAYNEALSYLTESLLKPSAEGADPSLGLVANALGHGLK